LLDTGPLAAIVDPSEAEHQRCVETLAQIEPPLLTCWPVITEAAWLLRRDADALRRLLRGAQTGFFTVLDLRDKELPDIEALYARYTDLSPQLADLTLLYLAARDSLETVFTLGRRNFNVFRLKGKKRLRLLPDEV